MVWTIAIPLFVIAASFLILAIGLLLTLGKTAAILEDIEDKLHALNPVCRIIYRLGEHVEECCERHQSRGAEIAELILSGISLFRKWRRK